MRPKSGQFSQENLEDLNNAQRDWFKQEIRARGDIAKPDPEGAAAAKKLAEATMNSEENYRELNTSQRLTAPVSHLAKLEAAGDPTEISGDALARARAGVSPKINTRD